MSELRPVQADYDPGYPKALTPDEVRDLLRPGLLRRFSSGTMLAGAVVVGAIASSRASAAPSTTQPAGGQTPPNVQVKSTRANAELKERVDKIIEEVLGDSRKGFWNERAALGPKHAIDANPPVKYPSIPISFGNSYIGIFDTEAAKAATRQLFAAYGIELKPGVTVKGQGYECVADGFDPKTKIGFKLMAPEGAIGLGGKVPPKLAPEAALTKDELDALNRDVQDGKVKLFVVDAGGFPNMDNDLFTPMQYYLASVIDYLNWIHGDQQIDADKVLGELPGGARKKAQPDPALPHP